MQQSFLPMVLGNQVYGVMAIPTQSFTGSETSITILGLPYPLKHFNYSSLAHDNWNDLLNPKTEFMAIELQSSEARSNFENPNLWLDNQVEGVSAWRNAPGHSFLHTTYGPLLKMLQARGMDYAAATPSVPPIGSPFSYSWSVNHPFANLSQYAFIDINWLEMFEISSGNQQPASLSIGTPTADPGAGLHLRLMQVQNSAETVNDALKYTTIRVIKVTAGAAASGTYTWPLTVTNTAGQSVVVTLDVVVP